MGKSLYRKVMLGISSISMILLLTIVFKIYNINLKEVCFIKMIKYIIDDTYFSSIFCSIVSVVIIYFIQIKYSKAKLKKNKRCNETIQELYEEIEEYCEIIDEKPSEIEIETREIDAKNWYDFYKKMKSQIENIEFCFSGNQMDILISSIESCFFINLNFELLNIINDVKDRLNYIRENKIKLEEEEEKYKAEQDKDEEKSNQQNPIITLGVEVESYIKELGSLASAWKKLLDYLKYDPMYVKLFVELYKEQFDIDDINDVDTLMKNSKKIKRKGRIALLRYRLKKFWEE